MCWIGHVITMFLMTWISELTDNFAPGQVLCMHLSTYDLWDEHSSLIEEVQARSKTIAIAKYAYWTSAVMRWWGRDRSVNWLAKSAGISEEEAEARIAGLPVHVGPRLGSNAGDPRKALGIVAAMGNEDVFVYDTVGNSPWGCEQINKIVVDACRHQCVINLSPPGRSFGSVCPEGAVCVTQEGEVLARD